MTFRDRSLVKRQKNSVVAGKQYPSLPKSGKLPIPTQQAEQHAVFKTTQYQIHKINIWVYEKPKTTER